MNPKQFRNFDPHPAGNPPHTEGNSPTPQRNGKIVKAPHPAVQADLKGEQLLK